MILRRCVLLVLALLWPASGALSATAALAATATAAGSTLRIRFSSSLASLRTKPSAQGTLYLLPGTRQDPEPGHFVLPVEDLRLLIPENSKVESVELRGGREVVVAPRAGLARRPAFDGATVAPSQSSVELRSGLRDAELGSGPTAAEAAPGARLLGEGWWHGRHLAFVRVRSLGIRGEDLVFLQGAELVVHLATADPPADIVHRLRELPVQRERERQLVAASIANPQDLDRFSPAIPPATGLSTEAGPSSRPEAEAGTGALVEGGYSSAPALAEASNLLGAKLPSLGTGPYRYLIITRSAMASAFQALADFRESQGLPALVVSVEEILASYRQGLDLAETIRLYLRDAYEKWGVDYVLLGGDTQVVPTRFMTSTYYPTGGQTEIPADFYFAGLDGNWNADGDAIFGEPYLRGSDPGDFCDFVPELAVGRAPVNDAAEATVFVNKVIAYEQAAGSARFNRALFAAEVLFPQDWQPGDAIVRDGTVVSEGLVNTITSWSDGPFSSTRRYQNYTEYPGAIEETKAAVLSDLNAGSYGLFHHVGHGFYYNMSVGDANIFVNDADQLTNGGDTFVLMALNCDSGAFDFDCLLERFLRNPNGGSVASVGSSRAAFDITTNEYQQALYKVIFKAHRQRLGDAILESRLGFAADTFYNSVDRWTQLVYVLLGDPAMRMWTGAPKAIVVNAPASVTTGSGPVTVGVTDTGGAPLDSVAVVLRSAGEALVAGWTDAGGSVQLDLPSELSRNWTLNVNGRNVQPFTGSIAVTAANPAELSVSGFSVDDSAGNGNGRIEAGELIKLTAVVTNGGLSGVSGGSLHLSSLDGALTVTGADAVFPPVPAGGQTTASSAFTVQVAESVQDGHRAAVEVAIVDNGGGSYLDEEKLLLESGEVEIVHLELDDSAGNGDGIVDPGEEVLLRFTLKNYGAATVDGISGALISLDPLARVLDGSGNWGVMDGPLSVAVNTTDPFTVVEDDTSAPRFYRLALTGVAGVNDTIDFDLRRPAQVLGLAPGLAGPGSIVISWDASVDRDLMGYRVFRRSEGSTSWTQASVDVLTAGALFLDENLPGRSSFEYEVEAVDAGGLSGPPSAVIQASTAPPEVGCFPLPMGQETSGALAVGELDGDGVADMAVPSNFIYAIDGLCREKIDGDDNAQTLGPISKVDGGYGPSGLSMGNLDGLGYDEIVGQNWSSSEIYVYDGVGQLRSGWPVQMSGQAWTTPVLGDLDGDGRLEIVTNDVNGWTYAFHDNGSEVADGDGDPGTIGPIAPQRVGEVFGRTTPALLDVDGDGRPEILFGSKFLGDHHEFFYALKGDGSGNAAGWPLDLGVDAPFLASPAIGDIDHDGQEEIVALCENDSLYVWEKDGSRMAPFPVHVISRSTTFLSQTPSPALADFDGDGRLEIVAVAIEASDLARVHIFNWQGQERAGWPQTVPGLSESSPVVADLDGDASLDVVFGIGGGQDNLPSLLYVWDAAGVVLDGFPIRLDGFVRATPTVCDFNGDGNANLVLASWDKLIHVWDLGAPFDSQRAPWPTFHADAQRDGVYPLVSGKTVTGRGQSPFLRARLLPNIPNPFNPSTELVFELPSGFSGMASLSIYDAAGRRVRTLAAGDLGGGSHRARWDGKDESGAEVASGVYFSRLQVEGDQALTRKMVLVR